MTAGNADGCAPPVLDLVVPVYNEVRVLEASVRRLRAYLDDSFGPGAVLTIVDNASTDATRPKAQRLAEELPGVRTLHVPQRGRGGALRVAWSRSDALILAYTDVDLSTELSAMATMVAAISSGQADLAVGTRLHDDALVTRSTRREVISRGYNRLLRWSLHARFTDAQCGFKAIRADAARELMPAVRDDGWFFDTELLVNAERRGLRILDVPVTWVDDPDSRVDVVRTALTDLRGVARLHRRSRLPQLPSGPHVPDVSRSSVR